MNNTSVCGKISYKMFDKNNTILARGGDSNIVLNLGLRWIADILAGYDNTVSNYKVKIGTVTPVGYIGPWYIMSDSYWKVLPEINRNVNVTVTGSSALDQSTIKISFSNEYDSTSRIGYNITCFYLSKETPVAAYYLPEHSEPIIPITINRVFLSLDWTLTFGRIQ